MAVIRCPNCGKPNPDFVDACQYCEQPLTPASPAADDEAALSDGTIRKSLILRCPNCGKPNPDFLNQCQFCDTPLKTAGAAQTPQPGPGPEAEPAADLPDWLRALRGEAAVSEAPFTPPASEATHDWEWTGTGEAAPADDVPDWLKGTGALTPPAAAGEPAGEVPDWLKSATGPLIGGEPGPTPAGEMPDWLKGTGALSPSTPPAAEPAPADLSAGDIPDWLKSATGALTPEPKPAGEVPDWLKGTGALPVESAPTSGAPEKGAPEEGVPDWLRGTGALGAAAVTGAAFVEEPAESALGAETPDWLRDLSGGEAAPPAGQPALSAEAPLPAILPGPEDEPDFLNNLRGAATPVVEEEQPDWLKSLGVSETPTGTSPALDFSAPAPSAEEEPDWMRTLRGEGTPPAEAEPAEPEAEPDWLAALRADTPTAGESALPGTSPFALDLGDLPPSAAPEAAPAPGGEPDWLAALRPAAMPRPETPAAPVEGLELAQGELPSWLAAMRPVEAERTVEPEADDYEEKVGILSGMRGVLRAEPSVVLPGKSAVNVHTLLYTEAQASQAETLAAMLLGDKEAAPAGRRKARLAVPWERWLVTVVILFGLLAPPLLLPSLFPRPTRAAPETLAAFAAVEGLPVDRPVLIAFDYEPAQAGELGLLADAVVGHLARRGVPLVAVSTSLTGAGVAQATLDRLTAQNTYSETVSVINLGYLPGGPIGILQFSLDARASFAADFRGARYEDRGGLWQLPVLRAVSTLDDFGAVVVLSATAEGARAWIEQTQGQPTPLLLAVGAGVAPLVRPYYEAEQSAAQPRLAGFVGGVAGAAQYEARAGSPVSPSADFFWQMLGGGLWTSALLLIFGNLAHGALQALRRPQTKRKA